MNTEPGIKKLFRCLHCEESYSEIPEKCRCGRIPSETYFTTEKRFLEIKLDAHMRNFRQKCDHTLRDFLPYSYDAGTDKLIYDENAKCRNCKICEFEVRDWIKRNGKGLFNGV